jgi:nucleosome-remodeling factor subunit BPTF
MPLNPNEFFIGCEKCQKWFHPRCVGLTTVDAEKIEKFYCELCRPPVKPEVAPVGVPENK